MNTRKVIKTVFYPLVLMRREFIRGGVRYYKRHNLRKLAGLHYYLSMGGGTYQLEEPARP